jgi:hypothetical protein
MPFVFVYLEGVLIASRDEAELLSMKNGLCYSTKKRAA